MRHKHEWHLNKYEQNDASGIDYSQWFCPCGLKKNVKVIEERDKK